MEEEVEKVVEEEGEEWHLGEAGEKHKLHSSSS